MFEWNEIVTPIEGNIKLSKGETKSLVSATLFKQIIGSLRFMCNSRPNFNFRAVKRIIRYLKETSATELEAYSNSDWSGDLVERKTTSGY